MSILNTLIGKEVIVSDNKTGDHHYPLGVRILLERNAGGDPLVFKTKDGGFVRIDEIDIDPKTFFDTESKLKVSKKVEETPDEFGNVFGLSLKSDEETIYLSSALRSELELKDGDGVLFAIDRKGAKVKVYISKTPAGEDGYKVTNGEIKSRKDHRMLYRSFGISTLFMNFLPVYDEDNPDMTFYELGTKVYVTPIFRESTFDMKTLGYVKTVANKVPKSSSVKKDKPPKSSPFEELLEAEAKKHIGEDPLSHSESYGYTQKLRSI